MKTIKRITNLIKKIYEGLGNYLSLSNFTYMWSLGSMALICLIIQIISGLFLSMFYKPDLDMAFISVEYINRELYYGWLVRYIHMNGASVFFIVVYLHMAKHMLFGSYTYPRQLLWFSGMLIFICMIITAFLGYVLPWGQMSIWGATVITNIFAAVPVIGLDFVYWLWGGLSVENATLGRFYSLHFLFPFVILGLFFVHLMLLYEFGSNNILGIFFIKDNKKVSYKISKNRFNQNFPRLKKTYIIKRHYFFAKILVDPIAIIGLNVEQKEQYKYNRLQIEKAMKEARVEIKDLESRRYIFVIAFLFSSLILVDISPYSVYFFPFHLFMSLYYTWKIFKWEVTFINNYKMCCNPDVRVRMATILVKGFTKVLPITSCFGFGTIVGADTIYEKYYGESYITKLGKSRGVFKDDNNLD